MVLIGHDHLDDGGAPNIWRHRKRQSVCSVRISRGQKEKNLVHCLHCEGEQLKLPSAERDTQSESACSCGNANIALSNSHDRVQPCENTPVGVERRW